MSRLKSDDINKLTIKFPKDMTYKECMKYIRPIFNGDFEDDLMEMTIDPHHSGLKGRWFTFKDAPYNAFIRHVNVGLVLEIRKRKE